MNTEILQQAMAALGSGTPIVFIEKYVEHEVVGVESGGIGIQIVNGAERGEEARDKAAEDALPPCGDDDAAIVSRLAPIFYGIEAEARQFLHDIRGMKPTQVTAKVNELVAMRKISDKSHHRDLWTVLNGCGLYGKSEANWNRQVR